MNASEQPPGPIAVAEPAGPPAPEYPAGFEITYPAELNRWLPLIKWLLVIPHFFALFFVGIGAFFVMIWAFFAVLFTGRWPDGLRSFVIRGGRYLLRLNAYGDLLTDEYPPFALE